MQILFNTDDPISDLRLVADILHRTLASRDPKAGAQVAAQTVEQQLAAAAKIPGTPLNLKDGAPENKLANLVETKSPEGMPATSAEVLADAAIAKAAEPAEKPKRTRAPKPEVVKTVTADEVRAVMVERSKKGPEEIARQKQILTSMGFEKLSQVPPEKLVELKTKVEAE